MPEIFNDVGEQRVLYCPWCRKTTMHISISHLEASGEPNKYKSPFWRGFQAVAGIINDVNSITNVILGRPFACKVCNNEQQA